MLARLTALVSGLALFACSAVGVRETEEPKFTVLGQIGAVEVRQYAPRIAAETVVQADELDARSEGFRRLAGYIFGANQGGRKIDMTAPVAQQSGGAGEKIAMTTPVAQSAEGAGLWRIRFFMPASLTMETLPRPNDDRVRLVAVPPETMAVLRFSGVPGPEAVKTRTGELVAALEGSKWRPAGAPVAWFYDPPWTVPGLRRNEVAVPVSPN